MALGIGATPTVISDGNAQARIFKNEQVIMITLITDKAEYAITGTFMPFGGVVKKEIGIGFELENGRDGIVEEIAFEFEHDS